MVTFISKKAHKKNRKNKKQSYLVEKCGHDDDRITGTGKCFTCWYLDKHSEDIAVAVYQ
jgi:hypothetical protein